VGTVPGSCPWRATADLVRGRVPPRVSAWLLALSRYASIIGCLLSCFDWTSRYRGGLVEDDHHARTLEDSVFCHLVAVSVRVTFVYRRRHTFYPCAPLYVCHIWRSAWLAGLNSARVIFPQMLEIVCDWRSLYARHTVAWEGMCQCFHQCINGDSISCRTAPPFQKITNVFFVKKHKTKTFDANMPNCTRSSELFAEKNSYRMQVFGDQI